MPAPRMDAIEPGIAARVEQHGRARDRVRSIREALAGSSVEIVGDLRDTRRRRSESGRSQRSARRMQRVPRRLARGVSIEVSEPPAAALICLRIKPAERVERLVREPAAHPVAEEHELGAAREPNSKAALLASKARHAAEHFDLVRRAMSA